MVQNGSKWYNIDQIVHKHCGGAAFCCFGGFVEMRKLAETQLKYAQIKNDETKSKEEKCSELSRTNSRTLRI